MEIVFLLPTVFVLVLIAVYCRIGRKMEQEVDWEKNKDKYKYKGYRY